MRHMLCFLRGEESSSDSQNLFCKVCQRVRQDISYETLVEAEQRMRQLIGINESGMTWPLIVKGKARTQRLRAYGDAIVVHQAVAWIQQVMAAIEHLKVQSEMRGGQ